MRLADSALRVPAEHAGDFEDALVAVEDSSVGGRDASTRAFRNEDVVMRARRDLRKVRDREDLMVGGNTPHRFADLQSDSSADPRVHLVEHERRHVIETGEYRFEREHDARQLAA